MNLSVEVVLYCVLGDFVVNAKLGKYVFQALFYHFF